MRILLVGVVLSVSLAAQQPPASPAGTGPNPIVQEAQKRQNDNQLNEALALFEKAIASDPKAVDAHLGAGRTLDLLGRHADARRHFTHAIELATGDARVQPLSAMAVSYAFEGNAADSAKFYQQVFNQRLAAGNAGAAAGTANALARVYLETGDLANAEKWYRTGYETSKQIKGISDAERNLWLMRWHNAQGRIAARRGNAAEAQRQAAALNELLAKGQNEDERPQYHYLLGYIALEAGEHDRALAELQKANPDDPFVLGLLGRVYEKKGDAANARASYEKVLAMPAHSLNAAFARRWARAYLKG
jgi:tetratricopeptide (TPR) repeat protein